MSETGKIYEAISNVMAEVGAVTKSKQTQQGDKYKYRGVDDVMNALNPAMAKHKIFVSPEVLDLKREERTSKYGTNMIYSICTIKYTFYATDGSSVSSVVVGEAFDTGDKSINKSMSIAFKYACFQVFCIPTEEMKDPDSEVHEVAPKGNKQTQKPKEKVTNKASDTPETKTQEVGNQKITQVKVHTLQKELLRTGVSVDSICERYKVEELTDLTEFMFIKAMNGLKKTPTKGD